MKEIEFNLLLNVLENKNWSDMSIASKLSLTLEEVKNTRKSLVANSFLTEDLKITSKGINAIRPYKVDNAIIMAAGASSRCLPLSRILPKGLFVVKGEVLIEREIKQLIEAGISNIIVVAGYKSEKFLYLKEKYEVKIVINDEYLTKNNISSIFAIKDYLANSYICCADNYYTNNIFEKYVYESFYICNFTKEFADEYCISENDYGYIENIRRGGKNQWFTIGANFWSRQFSMKFRELLEKEYDEPETENLLVDDFHIKHLSKLPIVAKKMQDGIVYEFDTLEEIREFDTGFKAYEKEAPLRDGGTGESGTLWKERADSDTGGKGPGSP